VAFVAYQLSDFFGIIMGVFVISFIGTCKRCCTGSQSWALEGSWSKFNAVEGGSRVWQVLKNQDESPMTCHALRQLIRRVHRAPRSQTSQLHVSVNTPPCDGHRLLLTHPLTCNAL
jgi:hypothetical protein